MIISTCANLWLGRKLEESARQPRGNVVDGARDKHVLPDFARCGLEGAFDSYYLNPWKWALESVGDDAGRGQQFQMAPL